MLAVVLLTKNESMHLARALDSIAKIASEIFVIDSFSTDNTVEIARRYGAVVLTNKFVNQAVQFQWALDNSPIKADWIMRLDADEIIEPDLQNEIAEKLPKLPLEVVGVNLKRKHIFMDRWVKHGGRYPLIMLRIWRKGHGRIEQRWMDEHIVVFGGKATTFNGGFADHNLKDLSALTEKHNSYATREALDVLNQRLHLFGTDEGVTTENSSFQASTKRFVKEKIYNRIPFTISSTLYFLYRYIFQLGFLDGRSGLVYHFLQGYWYRFLVGAKIMELERAIAGIADKEAVCEKLSELTGYNLTVKSSEKS